MNFCSISGCDNRVDAWGWCHVHYRRWKATGDPMGLRRLPSKWPVEKRFAHRYRVDEKTGCWEWTGQRNMFGYGQIKDRYKTVAAHRVSYRINRGEIPNGMHVCHTCDNPGCVNPEHLFLGTNQDNVDDKVAKGRQPRCGGWKLKPEEVQAIRASTDSARDLAKKFDVSYFTIRKILNGKIWKNLRSAL